MNEVDNICYAILLCKSEKKFARNLLRIGQRAQIKFLLEVLLNYLIGNLPEIPDEVAKESEKYKRSFIKLLDKRSSIQTQKKIIYKLRHHISDIVVPFLLKKIKDD